MAYLPTLPRRSWLERSSIVIAASLVALGGSALLGWWLRIDVLTQPFGSIAAIKANDALCVLIIGIVLLSLDLGKRGAAWLALLPAGIAAASLAENLFHVNLGIDELLVADHLLEETAQPGRMSAMSSGCLMLVSVVLAWRGSRRAARARLFSEAVVSSITASAGFSTLLGYAASLPAVYRWGTNTATSPVSALALLLIGTGLLLLAWRETMKTEGGPPSWSPMPAVVGCLTLTIILWIGLREREVAYLGAKTQTAMDTLAATINFETERQASAVERLARRWADTAPGAEVVWEADARSQLEVSRDLGCILIGVVNPDFRTAWLFPREGNEDFVNFDHGASVDPSAATLRDDSGDLELENRKIRRVTIEAARRTRGPAISSTVSLGHRGKGLSIYAPIFRDRQIGGYVVGEFLYQTFFARLIGDHKLPESYHVRIRIGNEQVYDSQPDLEDSGGDPLSLEKTYPILDRRVRLILTPSAEALDAERRFLPELALGAGFGITLLLGLSVHLARSARAGQRAAELSNKKLHAENEERRRVEARLKISDERLRLALDSTQIGIFEWNVAAGHVYYSPGLWAMLGYEHGRMPATVEAWQTLIHPDDLPLYRRRVESQLGGIASFIEPEYRVRARGGEWRWVYTRSKTVAASTTGRPTRIIGTVQDITARREAEQALRESQAETRKLSLVASKTDNPVLIASPAGTIEWVNESFTRVMEYSLEEVVGKTPADFMNGPDTDPGTVRQIRQAMHDGQGLSTDVVHYSKSGRKYHLRLEIQPIRNETGQLQNFIAIETDITARVETEQNLRRAKIEADDASRAKSDFLASMSHEIRTPMNGVIGMTSLLMETPLNPEQRDFVNTIRTSGEALLTIINDILDFSKIESGKLELEHMPFELAVCLEEALDLFALQASAKKLEIVYHIDPSVPAWIMGDITRLRQVLVNLVNNAVKFTPSGSISIEISRLAMPAAQPGRFLLEFVVRDSGIGIPRDRVDRLFKAFSQVDSSTTRKYGGTGLGLAISQRLTGLMGGGIRVESTVGEGSSFIFTIAAEAAALKTEPAQLPGLETLREAVVLCVEDHPITQRRLRSMLTPFGAHCFFAPNARAALDLAPALPAPPKLVIIDGDETEGASPLDLLLPIAAPRLLLLPFGQTAPAAPGDHQPFSSLFKPFKTASFLHAVAYLFNPAGASTPSSHTASAFSERLAEKFPLDVLLAEDNAVNQKVALRFLERLGYRADAVGNGLEAVTTLEARHYHLVLMDLQMPEMDGLEASRQIRRRLPADRQPKIIALTANAMQGDRERCIEAGMDDYVSKPVKLHEIEAAIRRLFSKAEATVPPEIVG
ncbi:MAG TPA: response regulator [Opitutus sp.]|nr:response regulator [Opitutus sp.]